jgi:hypothetical protein
MMNIDGGACGLSWETVRKKGRKYLNAGTKEGNKLKCYLDIDPGPHDKPDIPLDNSLSNI